MGPGLYSFKTAYNLTLKHMLFKILKGNYFTDYEHPRCLCKVSNIYFKITESEREV